MAQAEIAIRTVSIRDCGGVSSVRIAGENGQRNGVSIRDCGGVSSVLGLPGDGRVHVSIRDCGGVSSVPIRTPAWPT